MVDLKITRNLQKGKRFYNALDNPVLITLDILPIKGVSPRTGKIVKGTLSTSFRDDMLEVDHLVTWDDFNVLGTESNYWHLEITESLFIKRDKPSLNKNIYFQELFLF